VGENNYYIKDKAKAPRRNAAAPLMLG